MMIFLDRQAGKEIEIVCKEKTKRNCICRF